jgi:acyl carrier protein
MDIKKTIKTFVIDSSFVEQDLIKEETLLFKEGLFDSMGFVLLLGFLEESFGIKPIDSDLVEENFESINAITDYVIRKQAA